MSSRFDKWPEKPLSQILKEQQLSNYIEHNLKQIKQNKSIKLEPFIVQVQTKDRIGDGNNIFPCGFLNQAPKNGSYIVMNDWNVVWRQSKIVIRGYNYLGGAQSQTLGGKLINWDKQRVESIQKAKIEQNYVIWEEPRQLIKKIKAKKFNYNNICQLMQGKQPQIFLPGKITVQSPTLEF